MSEERDFPDPFVGELTDFADDVPGGAALFRTAGRGDDAIGTKLVAADHDPDEGLMGEGRISRIAEGIVTLEAVGDLLAGGVSPVEADGEFPVPQRFFRASSMRSRDLCELAPYRQTRWTLGSFLENEFLILLGHTTDDADDLLGAFALRETEPSEAVCQILCSACSRTEQVLKRIVSASETSEVEVAPLAEGSDDEFAIEHIHLTADGLDEQASVVQGGRLGSVVGIG